MTKLNSTRVKAPTLPLPVVDDTCPNRTNDDVAHWNPSGTCAADGNTNRSGTKQLLSCKSIINVATQNVRSLRQQGKCDELACVFSKTNLSILVDHKLVHDEEIQTKQLNKCTLITSSAWRNSNGAANGGVGLLVATRTESALAEIKKYNERIIIAHFNGNPGTTIIVHYSPTEGSETSEEHYTNLGNAIKLVPKHNILLVIGDFNAHIGVEDAKYTYHNNTNTNGKFLLDLVAENNLVITNTTFQKRPGKLWTYISDMNGNR